MAEEEKPTEVEEKVEKIAIESKENIKAEPTEEVKIEVEKEVITNIPSEEVVEKKESPILENWKPKTSIGKQLKEGKITDIDEILNNGWKILEVEVTETLIPDLEKELLLVGQSKGKFGGGAKRVFKQTQKKTPEGNKPSFMTFAVIGNKNGYVGVGSGKSKDTVPAREKAVRNAKLNVFKIRRGCGSWECGCKTPHSIPFKVQGKVGSVSIVLMPAPKGKGLVVEPEIAKILRLVGIKDVWSKTFGQTKVKSNLIKATVKALRQLMEMKITHESAKQVGMIEGKLVVNE